MKSKTKYIMEINRRFFEAIDALQDAGEIKHLTAFCAKYGLYDKKYMRIRTALRDVKQTDYKHVDLIAIGYLVQDYNISADWIMTGKGDMYKTILQPADY